MTLWVKVYFYFFLPLMVLIFEPCQRCCSSVTALMLLDRYGIVNRCPLQEADPGCLLAHHWVLGFICSILGCLSFFLRAILSIPNSSAHRGNASEKKKIQTKTVNEGHEKPTKWVWSFDVLISVCCIKAHAKDKALSSMTVCVCLTWVLICVCVSLLVWTVWGCPQQNGQSGGWVSKS